MRQLPGRRTVIIGASLLALLVVLYIAQTVLDRTADAQSQGAAQAPRFEVDPLWPKPLPTILTCGWKTSPATRRSPG